MDAKRIDESTVKHVARLSRLSLSEKDLKKFSEQLGVILEYIEKLKKLDTKGDEARSHALSDVRNVFREDQAKASLKAEEALKNAPKRSGDFFTVPKVIE